MADAILERVWKTNAIRMVGDGVPAGDALAAQRQVSRWEQQMIEYPAAVNQGDG